MHDFFIPAPPKKDVFWMDLGTYRYLKPSSKTPPFDVFFEFSTPSGSRLHHWGSRVDRHPGLSIRWTFGCWAGRSSSRSGRRRGRRRWFLARWFSVAFWGVGCFFPMIFATLGAFLLWPLGSWGWRCVLMWTCNLLDPFSSKTTLKTTLRPQNPPHPFLLIHRKLFLIFSGQLGTQALHLKRSEHMYQMSGDENQHRGHKLENKEQNQNISNAKPIKNHQKPPKNHPKNHPKTIKNHPKATQKPSKATQKTPKCYLFFKPNNLLKANELLCWDLLRPNRRAWPNPARPRKAAKPSPVRDASVRKRGGCYSCFSLEKHRLLR